MLTGKYNDGIPDDSRLSLDKYDWLREDLIESESGKEKLQKVEQLANIADDLGIAMSQLALAWCLKNKNVSTVITGATKPEQVKQNMKAIEVKDALTPDVLERIEKVLDNKPEQQADFRR